MEEEEEVGRQENERRLKKKRDRPYKSPILKQRERARVFRHK